LTTVVLTLLKLIVGYVSGSVGVLSEGIHSFLDVISAAVAFFTIREAAKPADKDHPFGHGKFETLSSLVEAALLWAASGWIFYEGVNKLSHPEPIAYSGIALLVMGVSVVLSLYVYKQNKAAATITESRAIELNALHFLSDVVASMGVFIGLVIIEFTGWLWVDSAMAFGIALYIFMISWEQIKGALQDLVDTQLPDEEIKKIKEILFSFQKKIINYKDLKTRRSGAVRHIDFNLLICGKMSVNDSHHICDEIELAIEKIYPQSMINIHVEPCSFENLNCESTCNLIGKK